MVTASGRPSGTATTTMVTAYRKNCTGPFWLIFLMGKPLFSTHLARSVEGCSAHCRKLRSKRSSLSRRERKVRMQQQHVRVVCGSIACWQPRTIADCSANPGRMQAAHAPQPQPQPQAHSPLDEQRDEAGDGDAKPDLADGGRQVGQLLLQRRLLAAGAADKRHRLAPLRLRAGRHHQQAAAAF